MVLAVNNPSQVSHSTCFLSIEDNNVSSHSFFSIESHICGSSVTEHRSVQNRLTSTSLLEFGIVDSRLMSSFDFYRRNHASFFSQKREFHSLRHSPWPTHWLVFANCSIQTNRPDTKQKTSIFDPFFIPFILESLEFVFVASSSISSLLGFNVLLHVLLQC